jgi:hypothetical protein
MGVLSRTTHPSPGENAVDYILAKLALINRPHAGMQLCERDKVKLIRRGLFSWELRSALLANMPNTVNDFLATVRDKEESMRSSLGGGVMAAIHAAARPACIPQSAPPYVTSAPMMYVSPLAPVNYVTPIAPSTTTAPKPDDMTLMANMLGQVLAQVNRLEMN